MGKEGGLFLSEHDVCLRWNEKAFLLWGKARFGLWEKKEVCSYQNRTCVFGGTRKRFFCEEKKEVWSVGKEGGLFLSEQDLSLWWN